MKPETSQPQDWIACLKSDGLIRDTTILELHRILVRGLMKSLSFSYGGGLQAEDVAQEAIIKILASLDQFAGRSQFITWAMTIAIRIGISELRHKHFRTLSLDSMNTADNLHIEIAAAKNVSTVDDDSHYQTLETLKNLIETELTDKQRQVIQSSLDGLPIEEIARRMGSNRNAIYKLVHDARMRLRAGFKEAGMMATDSGGHVVSGSKI